MTIDQSQQDVERVLQTRDETNAYCDKITNIDDLLSDRREQSMRDVALTQLAAGTGCADS